MLVAIRHMIARRFPHVTVAFAVHVPLGVHERCCSLICQETPLLPHTQVGSCLPGSSASSPVYARVALEDLSLMNFKKEKKVIAFL